MKKTIFLVSILVVSLFFFGCGTKTEIPQTTTPDVTTPVQTTTEPTTTATLPATPAETEKPKGITFTEIDIQQIYSSGNNPVIQDNNILWDKTLYTIDSQETKEAKVIYPYVIDNNKVYFLGQGGVHSLDILTNEDKLITPTTTIVSIDAENDNIVWTEGVKVYFYNALTQTKTMLSEFGLNPRISGENIIWVDGKDGYSFSNADLFYYNINTSTQKKINNLKIKSADKGLDIYGENVAYTNYNPNTASNDIYLVNINTEEITPIKVDAGEQIRPDIYENLIVWEDYNVQLEDKLATSYDIPTQILIYNINDGKTTPATTGVGAKLKPQIDQNHIVWYGRSGIYLAILS